MGLVHCMARLIKSECSPVVDYAPW